MKKWILVVAARPNFMKIAPLIRAINKHNNAVKTRRPKNKPNSLEHSLNEIKDFGDLIQPFLVHTGQHYDDNMSDNFFRDLMLPLPDTHLGVGSGTHAEQTGRVMIEFERILVREKPQLVIVVGDVNSTMACTLATVKLNIPVAHVEAGLRSFDRSMPEEINRIVTDAVADYLFTPSPDGDENLLREGIQRDKIFLVGNIMVDSLLFYLDEAKKTDILSRLSLNSTPYALVTLHRPANVDCRETFERIIHGLLNISQRLPVIFPIHPRTRRQVSAFGFEEAFVFHLSQLIGYREYFNYGAPTFPWNGMSIQSRKEHDRGIVQTPALPSLLHKIHTFPPLGYLDCLNLIAHAAVVLTDSGGIQEETTVLNVPCLTLRDSTERPVTLTEGTNVLVPNDPDKMLSAVDDALSGRSRREGCPTLWDGHTAERIVSILATKQ